MKRTPQNTMTSFSVCGRLAAELERIALEIGDRMEQRRLHVVVAEDDGVPLAFEPVDLRRDLGLDRQLHIRHDLAKMDFHIFV